MTAQFWRLGDDQSRGLACAVCGIHFAKVPAVVRVSVGRSESGHQVFACAGPCALTVVSAVERMAAEMRAAAAQTGDDLAGALGGDGEYGRLLRELRVLVGAEAMLATLDDLCELRFVLRLAASHAESVMERSRRMLILLALAGDGDD